MENERSDLVEQELALFIIGEDMEVARTRAWNTERIELAQEIGAKKEQVDAAIQALYERKGAPGGGGAGQARRDKAASSTAPLQSQLEEAIAAEDYATAAQLRDQLKQIQAVHSRAEALSSEWDIVQPILCLGQRVIHRNLGYRAVVVGWDKACCESEAWRRRNGVDNLSKGAQQPFYHLLVDSRDWTSSPDRAPVAYVAEELLTAPALEGTTWVQKYAGVDETSIQHAFAYRLLLGTDGEGNYIPSPQLRKVYSAQRKDVYTPEDAGGDAADPSGSGPEQ